MKQITAFFVAMAAALATPAWAQKPADDHSAHHGAAKAPVAALADGEVRKVDKAAKKITLKHGPIPSIDMPAMTMVFPVKDPKMLEQVKAGDKVKFQAEMINGAATVTKLQRAQ